MSPTERYPWDRCVRCVSTFLCRVCVIPITLVSFVTMFPLWFVDPAIVCLMFGRLTMLDVRVQYVSPNCVCDSALLLIHCRLV